MSTVGEIPQVGDERELLLVENLTRTQIVQYAGAGGDFNPIHTDEVFATKSAGFPSVFAHGMLTMAMTGRIVTNWFGPAAVRKIGVRMRLQVWPGDTLTATAKVTAVRPGDGDVDGGVEVDLDLQTTNQDGGVVLTGTSTVVLTPGPGAAA